MATNLKVGETVSVPCARLDPLGHRGTALYKTTVEEIEGKMVRVRLPGGDSSDWLGASLLHRDVGILILNIGDLETEDTLLDPLAKSVLQFCRLLAPDDQVYGVKVRSLSELNRIWTKHQAAYSHVVWIGHGTQGGIKFAIDGLVTATQLAEALRVYGGPKKVYISLCCNTGYKTFGSVLSKATICSTFIGPFHSVEGAVASQFCQTFLATHLLDGMTTGVAFNKARKSAPSGASFRLWNMGKLTTGPRG